MVDDKALISQNQQHELDEVEYRAFVNQHGEPCPSPKQLAWQDMELGMFIHFGINTFHDLEWSDGTLDPATFNPVQLDCNQWIATARDLGARYAVLTVKHHDGFCLWQTETTDYSVQNSPWKDGKGDVVREFIDACKLAGMNAGLYLSPWDRHEPCYPDKEAYDDFYINQLSELLTGYNADLTELWFDGAGSAGREYDWERIIKICRKYQPGAVIFNMGQPDIRWAGNENGIAPYPLWNMVHKREHGGVKESRHGYTWMPAEANKPIRYHTWFYNSGNEYALSPVEELMKCYIMSVGRGANLLLNIAPGRDGLIPSADRAVAREFGSTMRALFDKPLNIASGNASRVTLEFKNPTLINCIEIHENLSKGQRVKAFKVTSGGGGTKEILVEGLTVGHRKIDLIPETTVSTLTLEMDSIMGIPSIKSFAAHYDPEFGILREYIED
ncbi:alpha-L-fucosidase [Candidatus Bathyarchaeota archaeon]|nr:alpha-L-fucosidase [Candidatus Bathyarchaeota archaeon]